MPELRGTVWEIALQNISRNWLAENVRADLVEFVNPNGSDVEVISERLRSPLFCRDEDAYEFNISPRHTVLVSVLRTVEDSSGFRGLEPVCATCPHWVERPEKYYELRIEIYGNNVDKKEYRFVIDSDLNFRLSTSSPTEAKRVF
ncbi:MAG: hypothetical protein V3V49_11570 [Candidatus Krumholzibacteria bacterium]